MIFNKEPSWRHIKGRWVATGCLLSLAKGYWRNVYWYVLSYAPYLSYAPSTFGILITTTSNPMDIEMEGKTMADYDYRGNPLTIVDLAFESYEFVVVENITLEQIINIMIGFGAEVRRV